MSCSCRCRYSAILMNWQGFWRTYYWTSPSSTALQVGQVSLTSNQYSPRSGPIYEFDVEPQRSFLHLKRPGRILVNQIWFTLRLTSPITSAFEKPVSPSSWSSFPSYAFHPGRSENGEPLIYHVASRLRSVNVKRLSSFQSQINIGGREPCTSDS